MGFSTEENARFALIEKFEKFSLSKEFRVFKQARETRLLLYTLRSNFRFLLLAINKFHKDVEKIGFWDPVSPYLRPNTQKKISKEIFNYLSSASAIIDISRRYSKNLLNRSQQLQYGAHVKEVFVSSIPHRIIRNIRNYISHYSVLFIGVSFEKSLSGETLSTFYVNTRELLQWNEWDAEERAYLNGLGKHLEIESLLKQYHIDFLKTQDFFYNEIFNNHYIDLLKVMNEMHSLIIEAQDLNFTNSLPFKLSAHRYLKGIIIRMNRESKCV